MMEGFADDAAAANAKQLQALECVFRKAAEDDIPSEVCCSNWHLSLKGPPAFVKK